MTKDNITRFPSAETATLPAGNIKVTREDWLNLALDVLVSDGVDQVKVMVLGEKLGVSRSSFYWYFQSRQDLLSALLDHWEATNTKAFVGQTEVPSQTITEAVCHVFRCFVNSSLFDNALEFAIRDWARRSGQVHRILDRSDKLRLDALVKMFFRHGYDTLEAETRARVLYYMQIGYNDADLDEPMEERLTRLPLYLEVFTGIKPAREEINAFREYSLQIESDVSGPAPRHPLTPPKRLLW